MDKHFSHGKDKKNRHNKERRDNDYKDKNKFNNRNSQEQDEVLPKIQIKVMECAYCHKPIEDLASAISSKENDEPIHYDCVIKKLTSEEKLLPNENITYIGQGKFAVVHFENPNDYKHFSIKRTIEWENREEKNVWRKEIEEAFSMPSEQPISK